jgi:hypothetical protein
MIRISIATALVIALMPTPARAEVIRFEAHSTREVSGGRSFGSVGPYEEVTGRLFFAVDPVEAANRLVVDLDKAPKNANGRVEFSADVVIYRPRDAARGNGIALIDVVNRGNKTVIGSFNRPGLSVDRDAGDGFIFSRGYTVVCLGWEFDVPKRDAAIRIDVPVAAGVRGLVRAMFTPASAARDFVVADLASYPPVDPVAQANTLTVRDAPLATPIALPGDAWHLSGNTVTVDAGFQPGRWYEVSYTSVDPPIAGLGFISVRDTASWIKHATDERGQTPTGAGVAPARYAVGFGSSQSGRFLRNFLYEGFNTDEKGRQALDGVMAHIAGAARIDLNRRWAIPTTQATYTATSFPFADVSQRDPVTGATAGGLDNPRARNNRPKIFYTNTAVEYWGGGRVAALAHTSPDGARDLELPANERVYFLAGSQHGPAAFPPAATNGQQKDNPTDYWWVMRALLVAMEEWVLKGTTPPDNQYPRLADKTLMAAADVAFPLLPKVRSPNALTAGGRAANRLVAQEGAPGTPLPLFVPQVDSDGNERAGIRLPAVSVPLATVTGWNFRKPEIGAPDQLFPLLGSYMPFSLTKAAREAAGDPRRSIEERYRSREQYVQQVRDAANALVKGRYLLAEDVAAIVRRAEDHWNLLSSQSTSTDASREPR